MTINRRSRTLWKIGNTVRYLGVEVDDALALAVQTDVELALAAVSA